VFVVASMAGLFAVTRHIVKLAGVENENDSQ
jgi:hypothetical protein